MTQEYNRARHLFTSQRTAARAWEARNPKRSSFQETLSGSPLNFLRAHTRLSSWQQSERASERAFLRGLLLFAREKDCPYNIFPDALATCKIHTRYANPFHPLCNPRIHLHPAPHTHPYVFAALQSRFAV